MGSFDRTEFLFKITIKGTLKDTYRIIMDIKDTYRTIKDTQGTTTPPMMI